MRIRGCGNPRDLPLCQCGIKTPAFLMEPGVADQTIHALDLMFDEGFIGKASTQRRDLE